MNEFLIEKDFIITMERSGGFTGIISSIRIDSKNISENEKTTLRDLILSSGAFDSHANEKESPFARDTFQYIISIEDENGTRSVEVKESTPKAACHGLFNHLKSLKRS